MIKSLLEDEESTARAADSELKIEDSTPAPIENFAELNHEQLSHRISEINAEQTPVNPVDNTDSEILFNLKEETKPRIGEREMFQAEFKPESPAETIRKSGLAYAAGITLFGSIVFLLIIGWFVDLMFGTSPWGTVIGIVLGSIVGFLQFFRITSQILKDKE